MSLTMAALRFLPREIRLSILRSQMQFSEEDLSGVIVKQVETPEEALAASHIVHRAYARRGLVTPGSSDLLRVTPHSILPTTRTFVAKVGERYVGALSLVADGVLGLPLAKIYAAEVEAFRLQGERLAEVGSLAILPAFRKKGIAFLLYRMMLDTADAMGVDRIVMAVHPKAEDLYRASVLSERFGSDRCYPGLDRRALAVGLCLDLRTRKERYRSQFGHLPKNTANPYYMYFESHRPEIVPPRRELDSSAHDAIARALVAACPEVFQELPLDVRARLRSAMPKVRITFPEIDVTEARSFALSRMVPA